MTLTVSQIKQLVNKYPYLAPVNVWTGEMVDNYDYTYISGEYELPVGWQRLFLCLCKELRPHLIKNNILNKFYFTELKEKYGTMRVYVSCIPDSAEGLIGLYESFSKYICFVCGQYSTYVTPGHVSYLCDTHCPIDYKNISCRLRRISTYTTHHYTKAECYTLQKSFRPLFTLYNKILKMTDKEFFDFLIQD